MKKLIAIAVSLLALAGGVGVVANDHGTADAARFGRFTARF